VVDLSREGLDREFPSRRHGIQFNHAAVSPLPARAANALNAYLTEMTARGPLDWAAWGLHTERLRELAAGLIGADASVGAARSMSIVANTTTGLAFIAGGVDWRAGDVIVTTASEFPANLAPWIDLARLGVEVRRIPTRDGAFSAADVEAACDARTRLVSLSAVAYHSGFVAPAVEVGAFCKEKGIVFGLDGIQAVGSTEVDVVAARADFLSADGHKWMLGPEGCGILYTAPEFRSRLRAPSGWLNMRNAEKGDYRVGESVDYAGDARRFEPGALPMPGIRALEGALDLLAEIGVPTVRKRIAAVHTVLIEGLTRLGWDPVLFGGPPRSGILSARPPSGKDVRDVARALAQKAIAVSARGGFLRLSPHVGNDEAEAERVIAELKAC
jgi:selenocysteine lyase/cysteine desulfurase